MRDQQKMVEEFHAKLGFPVGIPFAAPKDPKMKALLERYMKASAQFAQDFLTVAKQCSDPGDKALGIRFHLRTEEGGAEAAEAALSGDEQAYFDALCDLLYVTLGDGVVYDFPLYVGFAEVQRSNMTKEVQAGDADKDRVRDKGPNYVSPDMKAALLLGRAVRGAEIRTEVATRTHKYGLRRDAARSRPVSTDDGYTVWMSPTEYSDFVSTGGVKIHLTVDERSRAFLAKQDAARAGEVQE